MSEYPVSQLMDTTAVEAVLGNMGKGAKPGKAAKRQARTGSNSARNDAFDAVVKAGTAVGEAKQAVVDMYRSLIAASAVGAITDTDFAELSSRYRTAAESAGRYLMTSTIAKMDSNIKACVAAGTVPGMVTYVDNLLDRWVELSGKDGAKRRQADEAVIKACREAKNSKAVPGDDEMDAFSASFKSDEETVKSPKALKKSMAKWFEAVAKLDGEARASVLAALDAARAAAK